MDWIIQIKIWMGKRVVVLHALPEKKQVCCNSYFVVLGLHLDGG